MMYENLLKEFSLNEGVNNYVIAEAEAALQWSFPRDYKSFLQKANGGEGFIGEDYLILWAAEELVQFNKEYEVKDYAPGLILIGSSGGGEGYAFDTRTTNTTIVKVPFIGMDLKYALPLATSFSDFLTKLAE